MNRRMFLRVVPSLGLSAVLLGVLPGGLAAQVISPPVQLPARPPVMPLTGVSWRVLSFNDNAGGLAPVLPETILWVAFDDNGRLSGNAGCNAYTGSYAVDGASVKFGPLASTRRACLSDAANAQESMYLAAFGASTAYELVGDRLRLRDAADATQVLLVRPTVDPDDDSGG